MHNPAPRPRLLHGTQAGVPNVSAMALRTLRGLKLPASSFKLRAWSCSKLEARNSKLTPQGLVEGFFRLEHAGFVARPLEGVPGESELLRAQGRLAGPGPGRGVDEPGPHLEDPLDEERVAPLDRLLEHLLDAVLRPRTFVEHHGDVRAAFAEEEVAVSVVIGGRLAGVGEEDADFFGAGRCGHAPAFLLPRPGVCQG